MSTGSVTEALMLEQLSALADGETDPAGVEAACARWRDDIQVRASWHAYHLIRDVMRSEDLAIEPSRDVAFLAAVRDRLSREAVVLAPAAERGMSDRTPAGVNNPVVRVARRWPWVVSSAVAAGFVGVVVGTFTLTRQAGPETAEARTGASVGSPTLAPRTDAESTTVATSEPAPARPLALDERGVVRDPSLDAYLAAHKQFAGSTALGVPSAFLRSATVRTYGR